MASWIRTPGKGWRSGPGSFPACRSWLRLRNDMPLTGWLISNIYFPQFWGLEVRDRGASVVGFGKSSAPGLQMPSSHCVLAWAQKRGLPVPSAPYQGTNPGPGAPHSVTSSRTNYLSKASPPDTIPSGGSRRVRASARDPGRRGGRGVTQTPGTQLPPGRVSGNRLKWDHTPGPRLLLLQGLPLRPPTPHPLHPQVSGTRTGPKGGKRCSERGAGGARALLAGCAVV